MMKQNATILGISIGLQKPTEAQIIGAIKGNLEGNEINVKEITSSIIPDFISCDACNCPNGRKFLF